MGFLKKIFKPVSKVLDKIIPNEIKPALPYLAAFAPVFGPTAGMFGSTMGKRMLLSGGANILGQLSQEGSEGDINLLSAGLGALTGAMTTPGAAETFQGMKTPTGSYKGVVDGVADTVIKRPELSFLDQAKNFGLEGLSKGANILRPEGGIPDLFSKAGAKAATLPAATATGDVMEASARQLEKQTAIDEALAAAELLEDSGARAAAIRNAMNAYGFFTDEEIEDTIFSAGYRAGGRVGLKGGGADFGGIPAAIENIQEDAEEMITIMTDNGPIQIEKSVYESMPGMFMDTTTSAYGDAGRGRPVPEFAEGGLMNAKRGLVDEPGGYAGEKMNFYAAPLNNKIEGFNKQMMDEYLQGNYPEYEGERVSDSYNRPNFTDVSAVIKIIEMGGDFDDVRETLKIDISDERIKDFIKFDQEKKEKKSSENFYMKDGGLMNLGGKEMDMRGGGFIPIGKKERADDVPARLSKNEFVMTADAVRAAGGGSVNKGAKRMYDVMNKLEARA